MTQENTDDAIEDPPDPLLGHSERFLNYAKWCCRLYAGRGINGNPPAYRLPFDKVAFNPRTREITYKQRTSHVEPIRRGRHKVTTYYALDWGVSIPVQDITQLRNAAKAQQRTI
ncbi:MAG: hypothetical protein AABY16_00450 [Nanoarchaeota archaeon]